MLHPAISIDQALSDPNLLGAGLGDADSWAVWRVILKAAFALPLTEDERAVFASVAGDRDPPTERVAELWVIAGRRGGKSRMAGAISAYLASFSQHELAKGETGYVLALAVSKAQARAVHDYTNGYFEASPILRHKLNGEPTADEIRLHGNVTIAVHPANFRTVRSRTLIGCVYDEVAFWRDGDSSTNPDSEIYTATLPALATTNGLLVAISSPYRRAGLLYRKFEQSFGQNDPNVLVVKAPTLALNPTIHDSVVERAREMDPDAARSEWDAEFRSDISDFLSQIMVRECVTDGVTERPPERENRYVAFCDPSGGSSDSMTLAIAHKEGDTAILDCARETKPPFNPEAVVKEYAELLRGYRLSDVTGDRYGSEWVRSTFSAAGIHYKHSERSKSDIYLDAVPGFNARAFDILDNPRLIGQITGLERRTSRSGKDIVDHARGAKDDLANAALGALVLAQKQPTFRTFWRPSQHPKISDPLVDYR